MRNKHNDQYLIELLDNTIKMIEEYKKRVSKIKKR